LPSPMTCPSILTTGVISSLLPVRNASSTTHLAARMEQMAKPGSVLATADTLRLVEGFVAVKPLGPVPVKGLADPVEVYEVTGAGPAPGRRPARADPLRRPRRPAGVAPPRSAACEGW
jgi:hypothetical protein